jgi:riboflavin kinase / FMN adenylyltransferase
MSKFQLAGTTKPYSGQGRGLGYPTANIECPSDSPEGVFVGFTTILNRRLPSIIFIGKPETVGDYIKRAETHILDFEDKDLYGYEILIEVEHKLRNNKKFESKNELVINMKADEKAAREWFRENQ